MVAVDVVGLQADPGLAVARRPALRRRGKGDRGFGVAGSHLDPAVAVAERDVGALLEAELLDVERDRCVLVGDGHHDGVELVDASLCAGHNVLLGGFGSHVSIDRDTRRNSSPTSGIGYGAGGEDVSSKPLS